MRIQENRTLEATVAEQQDIASLCADRPLPVGELFPPNSFYGMGEILKNYAGLPWSHRLRTIVPHGVVFNSEYVWESEIQANLPVVLCYPEYRSEAYRRRTDKYIWAACSPYVYLVESLGKPARLRRKGTLFFPAHSTRHITTEMDYLELVHRLRALEDEFQPVTVCLYWRDVQLGRAEIFKQAGFPVVSAGHIHDPIFLYRLYNLLSVHRYASSNEFGSHTFYSLISGSSFFYLEALEPHKDASEAILARDTAPPPTDRQSALHKLFLPRYPNPSPEQMEAANDYLGLANKLSPPDLYRQLRKALLADYLGIKLPNGDSRLQLKLPTFWRRVRKKIGRVSRTRDNQ